MNPVENPPSYAIGLSLIEDAKRVQSREDAAAFARENFAHLLPVTIERSSEWPAWAAAAIAAANAGDEISASARGGRAARAAFAAFGSCGEDDGAMEEFFQREIVRRES